MLCFSCSRTQWGTAADALDSPGCCCLVLLIACANVANLLQAKAADGSAEIAIRNSLALPSQAVPADVDRKRGAFSGWGVLGLLLAYLTFQGLLSLAPPNLPRLNQVALDWRRWCYISLFRS